MHNRKEKVLSSNYDLPSINRWKDVVKKQTKKTVPGTGSKGIYLECIKLGFTSQGSRIKTGLISQRISKARPGQWTRELICHVARAWKMSYDWQEEPTEGGKGGNRSLALTVKSGRGGRNLWSLRIVRSKTEKLYTCKFYLEKC